VLSGDFFWVLGRGVGKRAFGEGVKPRRKVVELGLTKGVNRLEKRAYFSKKRA